MFIVDAHLDLAMNALEWNRDLTQPIEEIRMREEGLYDKPDRGKGTVCFQELRKGNIGLVVATQIARFVTKDNPLPGWNSPEQAWAHTQGQLSWYKAMERKGELVQIIDSPSLERHLQLWGDGTPNDKKPIGYILSLEGADSLVNFRNLEEAWHYGLRAVGPAHYGPGRYANGTDASGGFTSMGKQLLKEMEKFNLILDVTHLCDESFWDALDLYHGNIWASHSLCRALVDNHRQLDDRQLKMLIERGAVIGGALAAWMMVPGWIKEYSTPKMMNCSLERLIDHIDHICQIAGNSLHVGIGSDLDGGFGKENSPYDLETIADLTQFPSLLKKRGYTLEDTENIMHKNWLRFLREAWSSHDTPAGNK